MNLFKILDTLKVKIEDLNSAERETLQGWIDAVDKSELTIQKLTEIMQSLIEAVEREIVGYEVPNGISALIFRKKRRIHLDARLKCYLTMREMLMGPDRAKKALEQAITNLKIKK